MRLVKEVGRNCSVSLIIGRISLVVYYLSLQNSNLQLALKIIGIIIVGKIPLKYPITNGCTRWRGDVQYLKLGAGLRLFGLSMLVLEIPAASEPNVRATNLDERNSCDGKRIFYFLYK